MNKTDSYKSTATIVGVLFIVIMITWSIGYAITGTVVNSPHFLASVFPNKGKVVLGVIFEFIEIISIVGIVALLFPLIKKYNESMAIGYLALRILECSLLLVIALTTLFMITLSQDFLDTGSPDASHFSVMGKLLLAVRGKWTNFGVSIFYGTGAIVFQYFLYRTGLVPKFISLWGLISAILILAVAPFETLGYEWLGFVGLSMGLNEIFLGVWLIIRGFNQSVIKL